MEEGQPIRRAGLSLTPSELERVASTRGKTRSGGEKKTALENIFVGSIALRRLHHPPSISSSPTTIGTDRVHSMFFPPQTIVCRASLMGLRVLPYNIEIRLLVVG